MAKPKNISLEPLLVELAEKHIKNNRKLRNFSNYVAILLARDLRKKGIRVPDAALSF